MLITTRNPNSKGILAKGLEVFLLDSDDEVDLLFTLSKVVIAFNSPEKKKADKIVAKLGYLSSAIAQVAMYIREIGRDFLTFLKDYKENNKDIFK